jgi:acyl carrier protein
MVKIVVRRAELLKLDSFDIVTLVAKLDRNYGISIHGTDIIPENFQTVPAIQALLRKNGVKV